MKTLVITKAADRSLRRLPLNVQRMIAQKIRQYVNDPLSLANNVKALKGRPGEFRLRVGDWRVIMTQTGDTVTVVAIAARGAVYD